MEQINRFTRRGLREDEVYVFSVALCDNEVDRDGERFTDRALEMLGKLFVGKTGIFDHNPKGQNQTARIFDAKVEETPGRMTEGGRPYRCVKARAYMVRTKANEDLILEIDGGIKKEVSVGCAVSKAYCSVCGKDPRKDGCSHERGKRYDGVLCCVELDEPTDAYEWSFVAVPAQVGAGVVKSYREREALPARSGEELLKAMDAGPVTLSGAEAGELAGLVEKLTGLARAGEVYRARLREDTVRLGYLADCGIPAEVLADTADKMDTAELETLCKAFSEKIGSRQDCQLLPGAEREETLPNQAFCI